MDISRHFKPLTDCLAASAQALPLITLAYSYATRDFSTLLKMLCELQRRFCYVPPAFARLCPTPASTMSHLLDNRQLYQPLGPNTDSDPCGAESFRICSTFSGSGQAQAEVAVRAMPGTWYVIQVMQSHPRHVKSSSPWKVICVSESPVVSPNRMTSSKSLERLLAGTDCRVWVPRRCAAAYNRGCVGPHALCQVAADTTKSNTRSVQFVPEMGVQVFLFSSVQPLYAMRGTKRGLLCLVQY